MVAPTKRGYIGGHAPFLEPLEILAQGPPGHRISFVETEDPGKHVGRARLRQRPHADAFAEHLEGHALHQVAQTTPVVDEAGRCPAQHVDEPGRHRHARGIDDLPGGGLAEVADCRDAVARDGQVERRSRRTAAVVQGAPADDDVVAGHRDLAIDPALDAPVQNLQGQGTAGEYLHVKVPQVESLPERTLGAPAQFADFQLAVLVGCRLAWIGDVAVDFRDHIGSGQPPCWPA